MLVRRPQVNRLGLLTRRYAALTLSDASTERHGCRSCLWPYRAIKSWKPLSSHPSLIQYHGAPPSPTAKALLAPPAINVDEKDGDEWDAITALESNRVKLDWRQRLVDDEAWELESNLDGAAADGTPRLVSLHGSDLELWEELFVWRLKHHGEEGAKMVWKHLLGAAATHSMRVWERPRLWKPLLQLLLEDHKLLHGLITYCAQVADAAKDWPDQFYLDVMKRVMLGNEAGNPRLWHEIMKRFAPNKSEVRTLFTAICQEPASLKSFQSFCFELPAFSGMYRHIVTELSFFGMHAEAFEWHELLIKHKDLPASFKAVEEVLRQLRKDGHAFLAHKMASGLHAAGVAGGRAWLRDPVFTQAIQTEADSDNVLSKDQVFPGLDSHEVKAKQPSDAFAARLLATSFFSVETVLTGLAAINVNKIGPLAFRQLLFRLAVVNNPNADKEAPIVEALHVSRALSLLGQKQMGIHECTFSQAVVQLAEEKDTSMLQSILRSDQHPDVLEDAELQDSLLMGYVERGSREDIDRTLAILRIGKGETYSTARRGDVANAQLELSIDRSNKLMALAILHEITRRHQNLDHHALTRLLYGMLFSPRAIFKQPSTYRELDEVTHLMMGLQRSGYAVPLRAWHELIRRRAWETNLPALQRLLDWKFRWVTDARFRLSQTYPDARPIDWDAYYRSWSQHMLDNKTYLQALFGKITKRLLLGVGFAADKTNREQHHGLRRSVQLHGSPERKARILSKDPALLGLRILKDLHDRGLPCDRNEIRRVCSSQLMVMFGPQIPLQRIDRGVQLLRRANWTDYAMAMEMIWGQRLFLRRISLPAEAPLFDDQESPSRLEDYCKNALWRVSIRMRLRTEQQAKGAGSRHPSEWRWRMRKRDLTPNRPFMYLRHWHGALPMADTDNYLQTLFPELAPSGSLENDPLLTLSPDDRRNLLRDSHYKTENTFLDGYSRLRQFDSREEVESWSTLHGRRRLWWQNRLVKSSWWQAGQLAAHQVDLEADKEHLQTVDEEDTVMSQDQAELDDDEKTFIVGNASTRT